MQMKYLKNMVEKKENDGDQHFIIFPPCIFALLQREIIVWVTFYLPLANVSFFKKNLQILLDDC